MHTAEYVATYSHAEFINSLPCHTAPTLRENQTHNGRIQKVVRFIVDCERHTSHKVLSFIRVFRKVVAKKKK